MTRRDVKNNRRSNVLTLRPKRSTSRSLSVSITKSELSCWTDNPILSEGLDLVEEDEQITHRVQLGGELDVWDSLSKFDVRTCLVIKHASGLLTE